ncbi:hypothetical protein LTR08_003904 [Meristemomyces frigidus]|nr:hypothetical protein LTR08_003904 [Meristemomyces frigidus]
MSQDLFAAFESSQPREATKTGRTAGWTGSSSPTPKTSPDAIATIATAVQDEEDDFGDFEDASATTAPPAASSNAPSITRARRSSVPPRRPAKAKAVPAPREQQGNGKHPFAGKMDFLFDADDGDNYDAGGDDLGDLSTNPEAAVAYSKRVIAAQQLEGQLRAKSEVGGKSPSRVESQQRLPNKLKKKSGYVPAKPSNVLFDIENLTEEEDADDFGNFEGDAMSGSASKANPVESSRATSSVTMPALDLLGSDEAPVRTRSKIATKQTGVRSGGGGGPKTSQTPTAMAEDDLWDDFEEAPVQVRPTTPRVAIDVPVASSLPSQRTVNAVAAKSKSPTGNDVLPPINIPPPALLLSIFASIFASAQDTLFDSLSKLDLKQRQVLLAHPATTKFLKGYLNTCVVLGHILAGRKLRWKRDQYLAQGMRIGPALAGGSKGGMKLAGVDKAEVAKEEREALDAVTQWKVQVGKLRSAVTAANSTPGISKLPPVPEIAEQMPVRLLKSAEGGFTATHACALCGLKREERVAKVDVEVNDSFGEWWVQGMSMHLLCRAFWDDHKGKLKSR